MTTRNRSPWLFGALLAVGALLTRPDPVLGARIRLGGGGEQPGDSGRQPIRPYVPGTVYLYRPGDRDGAWKEAGQLRATDGAPLDRGWLTEDQRFFLMDDELDELAGRST